MENRYTQSKLFSTIECPDQETLIRYVGGKLMPAQLHDVENHLLDCGLCSDTVDTLQTMGVPAFRNAVSRVHTKLNGTPTLGGDNAKPEPETKVLPLKRKKNSWMYGTAASVAVLVVATILFRGGGQGDIDNLLEGANRSVYEENAYRDVDSPREKKADSLYNEGKFLEAARMHQDEIKKGICYSQAGKLDSAVFYLEPIAINTANDDSNRAQWAYTLVLVQKGDFAEAQTAFAEAAERDKGYESFSKDLADDLEDLIAEKLESK